MFVMCETQKPFACTSKGCKMAFTNEDHLNVHKKKHAMALHLGIDNQNNLAVADQTPTPTRFIRNCEEVGLFQDLQNVNPFDETFRKATELAKSGLLHIPKSSSDDTLHTPHIFPHTEEENNISNFSRNNSNEPEFTVTTIDDHLLKLNDDKSDDAISIDSRSEIDPEELSLLNDSSDAELLDKDSFIAQSDPIISSCSKLVSKDGSITISCVRVPTDVPVINSFTNSDTTPVVVNNLSDIQINSNNKEVAEKLKDTLRNRVKTELLHSDDEGDTMIIQELESSISEKTVSSHLMKIAAKKFVTKHSIRDSNKSKTHSGNSGKARQPFTQHYTKTKRIRTKSQSQLERQREVNRAAQIRSREKKKCWISQMEIELEKVKTEKKAVWVENQNLKREIVWLKTMLLYHEDCPVSKDPKITEEINMLAKASQNELEKKTNSNTVKKVVPIRPNPASIISVTPTNSVLVQVPMAAQSSASAANSFPLFTSTPLNSNTCSVQAPSLPVLGVKPLKATSLSKQSSVSVPTTAMPKLISSSTASPFVYTGMQTLFPMTDPTKSNLIIKLPEDAGNPIVTSKKPRGRPKRIQQNRRQGTKLQTIRVNPAQIINLPNTVLPDDNYFILVKPNSQS